MSTKDLVNAIIVGDAVEIETAFNATMAEKISSRLDDYRQEVAQNMFKVQEEVELDEEQLDEISKDTLKSYVKKAANRAAAHAFIAGGGTGDANKKDFSKAVKRVKGIETAVNKLTKEEAEQILASEEFAQLDEISKKTLGSYIRKASNNMASATRAAGVEAGARGPNRWANMDAKEKRAEKRGTGISKAVDRLTKEDVEQLVVTTVESALYAMEAGRSVLDENIDEAVSSSSKQRYEYANKTKPKGHGQWMFTTVDPKEHDVQKHKDQTVSVTGSFADAAKKAHSHFKEKGHKGEIHVLS